METQLRGFLNEFRVAKDELFTHTTMKCEDKRWYPGRYYILDEYVHEFWVRYCNAARRKNVKLTVMEKPGAYTPLRVDFDFKFELENDGSARRPYTTKIVRQIVRLYQKEIKSMIPKENFEDRYLWCLVLEKEAPRIDTTEAYGKDGFHLHFPHFITEAWVQDVYLRDRVTKAMLKANIWVSNKFLTPINQFIDQRMASKTWMMYGSMNYKNSESTPYLYNRWEKGNKWGHAYDHTTHEMSIEDMFEDEMIGRKKSIRYYLPIFLSVRGHNTTTPLKDDILSQKSLVNRKPRITRLSRKRSREQVEEELRLIEQHGIMDMLSDYRAENYGDWMDVGWTLFNIGEGCEKALSMWTDFSRRSSKFVEGECDEIWQTMTIKNKTIGSLLYMAQKDSPDEYKAYKRTNINYSIQEAVFRTKKPNETMVAQIVFNMYPNRFVCVDPVKDIWYEFRNHRWVEDPDCLGLKSLLGTEVYEALNAYGKHSIKEMEEREEREKKNEKKDKKTIRKTPTQKLSAIKEALLETFFQRKVIQACKVKWTNRNFTRLIDRNTSLLGCNNGVLDLELGIFRDGRPEDYITLTTGQDFINYSPSDPEVKELDDYLLKVFPNRNLREYFQDFICAVANGNTNKLFMVATGAGNNSKTMMMKLLEYTFNIEEDGYVGKFPPQTIIVTKGMTAGQARADLVQTIGKRLMIIDEITHKQQLNIMELKRLTGQDRIYARGNYDKKGQNLSPIFTLILQCVTGNTKVSMASGMGISIDGLAGTHQILAWDGKGLTFTDQRALMYQGLKNTVTLTLMDGRKITCTPNHRFLSFNKEWIEAKDIEIGKTSLMMGIDAPNCDDVCHDCDYVLHVDKYDLCLINQDDRYKAAALYRLLGYLLYDDNLEADQVSMQQVQNDILLVTGDKLDTIPPNLYSAISFLRTQSFTDKPLFLIRELLASIFGRYGIPTLTGPLRLFAPKNIEPLIELLNRFGVQAHLSKYNWQLVIDKNSTLDFIQKIGVRYNYRQSIYLTAMASCLRYQQFVNDRSSDNLMNFFESSSLDKFVSSVNVLPCYHMTVVNIEESGERHVYDLMVNDNYSNFIAEGIVSHNCNDPPRIPGDDVQTWDRTRVVDFEARFVAPSKLKKWPVPDTFEEQLQVKRFHAELDFEKRLPGLAPVLLWKIFDRYKYFRIKGLHEPNEVIMSTDMYQTNNDVFRQFVNERLRKEEDVEKAKSTFLRIGVIDPAFQTWYRDNYPGIKEKVGRNKLKEEMNKRLGVINHEDDIYGYNDTDKKWYGWSIIYDDEDIEGKGFLED